MSAGELLGRVISFSAREKKRKVKTHVQEKNLWKSDFRVDILSRK